MLGLADFMPKLNRIKWLVLSFPLTLPQNSVQYHKAMGILHVFSYVLQVGSLLKSDTVVVKSVYTGQGAVLAGLDLLDPCSEGMVMFLGTLV